MGCPSSPHMPHSRYRGHHAPCPGGHPKTCWPLWGVPAGRLTPRYWGAQFPKGQSCGFPAKNVTSSPRGMTPRGKTPLYPPSPSPAHPPGSKMQSWCLPSDKISDERVKNFTEPKSLRDSGGIKGCARLGGGEPLCRVAAGQGPGLGGTAQAAPPKSRLPEQPQRGCPVSPPWPRTRSTP